MIILNMLLPKTIHHNAVNDVNNQRTGGPVGSHITDVSPNNNSNSNVISDLDTMSTS